ncbi:MAG TPA: GNAT family N-acetyltransferase [Roseiflexaceae bacterium]|nr:GNAT family N-acetyltransferase [Roseiflexaceae bacterium]
MRYTLHTIDDRTPLDALDRIWEASQDADDRGFRPRGGWWSLRAWTARAMLLAGSDTPIGGVALNQAPDGAVEARLALLPGHRTPEAAQQLVRAALADVQRSDAALVRLTLPAQATWARDAAAAAGLTVARATLVMLRPATLGSLPAAAAPGLRIRPLAEGEEGRVLHALNHAWAGSWNFRPLTRRALERDLIGQRAGFLLAVDDAGRIAGTIHAQFDQTADNPDGTPYAWLSNLTTAPSWRGRGLGRALLSAGITRLHDRGARSVALGVDSGAVAPITLYRSAGFTEFDRLELWEAQVRGAEVVEMGKLPLLATPAGQTLHT